MRNRRLPPKRNVAAPRAPSFGSAETADALPNRDLPMSVIGLHCDSCGAAIAPDTSKCEYCGQVPVILIQGVRLSVLLKMYLDADRYQEAQDVSSEVLREHPQSVLAWAVKGIATLRLGSSAPLGMRAVSDADVVSALKCFDNALVPGTSLPAALRDRAAKECLSAMADWRERWRSAYLVNSIEAVSTTFTVLHFLARSIGCLSPKMASKAGSLLADIDDSMERTYGCTWTDGDAPWKPERRERRPANKVERSSSSLPIPGLILLAAVLFYVLTHLR